MERGNLGCLAGLYLSLSALRCANQKCGVLDAIAVRVILVSAPALVGVEEVLIIVLVTLPLVEREADRKDNHDQDDAERVIVDTEGLARTLTARLIARQRTEVQRAVYAEHRLCVCRLRLESHSSCCGRRWNRLDLADCTLGCVQNI